MEADDQANAAAPPPLYFRSLGVNEAGRRLCITKQRGLLGNLPVDARTGGCVAIFGGFQLPCLLRPQGPHEILIEPCYVDGIMDSEAPKFDDWKIENIVLA